MNENPGIGAPSLSVSWRTALTRRGRLTAYLAATAPLRWSQVLEPRVDAGQKDSARDNYAGVLLGVHNGGCDG